MSVVYYSNTETIYTYAYTHYAQTLYECNMSKLVTGISLRLYGQVLPSRLPPALETASRKAMRFVQKRETELGTP